MNVESTEIEMEITEVEEESVEILQDVVSIYEVDGTETVIDVELLEGTESVLDTELVESTELLLDDTDASTVLPVVDYTEQLEHIVTGLDIIVMILLAWFGSWVLRSWRTWTVKGGR